MDELILLLSTNSGIYSNYVRSKIIIDAEIQSAKARIEYITRVSQLKVVQENKRFEETVNHDVN